MDIKLFVCCHEQVEVPKHPLLVPLQVGAALAEEHFPGFLHDDTGDNISSKNRSYCELTGQYWAWKNVEADYYGFFHYRRYLYPDQFARRPYRIAEEPSIDFLERLNYKQLSQLILQHDVILPQKENMFISVRDHYAAASFHHGEDLNLLEKILFEQYPEFSIAVEQYLSSSACYFGNIYIMARHFFEKYCAWLFSILNEFDQRSDSAAYGPQEQRVDGYLAERLLGIYCTYHQGWKLLELPRVHFISDSISRYKQQVICAIFPPSSRRRSWAKRLKG